VLSKLRRFTRKIELPWLPHGVFSIKNIPVFLIVVVWFLIARANYTPNTYLSGWDTLHPEFNYGIYWKRILGGVWQEHQGLGAVATQAHASEIPRVLILMVLDIFLTTAQIRYAYSFLMLLLGPLGVYYLLSYILKKEVLLEERSGASHRNKFADRFVIWTGVGAFTGALVYLFNLAVLQQFYVPLEMFLTHYGSLGWFYLFLVRYLRGDKKESRQLLLLGLVSFFSASQAHTATLFYAHMLCLVGFMVAYLLQSISQKKSRGVFRRTVVAFCVILGVNLFWFLPNVYFALMHGKDVQQAKIHRLFSQEAFLQNKKFGNIKDIAVVKNFLFNWGVHTGQGVFGSLLSAWEAHLATPGVYWIGYGVFGLVCMGALLALLRLNKLLISFLVLLLIGIFFLFNVNPPVGNIFIFFQENVPLFKEAFRFPFTKFSILVVFAFSLFVGYLFHVAFTSLSSLMSKKWMHYSLGVVFCITVLLTLSYYGEPFFRGYLISPYMRVYIPDRYFDMFDYLDAQEEVGRVANLPIQSFWGWTYYSWNPFSKLGYQGAGFLWFGIKQPLLDREFDRWGKANEQYYREMSYAVYSQDTKALEDVLEKFQVKWILVDKSVFAPGYAEEMLFYPQIDELLASSPRISLDKDFGSGLLLYTYSPKSLEYAYSRVMKNPPVVGNVIYGSYTDPVYSTYGDYVSSGNELFPLLQMILPDEQLDPGYISSYRSLIYINIPEETLQNTTTTTSSTYLNMHARLVDSDSVLLSFRDRAGLLAQPEQEVLIPHLGGVLDKIIVVGDRVIRLPDLGPLDTNLGDVLLPLADPLEVPVYTVLSGLSKPQVGYVSTLDVCSASGANASYSLESLENGFRLASKASTACVTLPLGSYLSLDALAAEEEYLVLVDLNIIDTNSVSDLCLFQSDTGLCMNEPLRNGLSHGLLPGDSLEDTFLRFSTHGLLTNKTAIAESSFSDIEVSAGHLEEIRRVSINNTLTEYSKFVFPKKYIYSDIEGLSAGDPRVCGSTEGDITHGSVTLAVSKGTTPAYVRYRSAKKSLCDSFHFASASHAQGYLLSVTARNIAGLPLRLCLTNEYSKRCDFYVSLADSSDFTTQYFLIPPYGAGGGYTANFSNLVIADTSSVNDLVEVSLTPVPYDLFLGSANEEIPLLPEDKFVFVHNQAFEPGWGILCGIWPCRGSHVVVNSWENGWILNSAFLSRKIRAVFWPGLLEVFGLVVLLAVFIVLFPGVSFSRIRAKLRRLASLKRPIKD
jgi:hypothetical protein